MIIIIITAMPDKTSNTVQPQMGLVTDTTAFTTKRGSWTWAYNVNVETLDGEGTPIPQNEHSSFLYTILPAGYVVVGYRVIREKDRVLYMLVNPSTNMSQIGEVAISKAFIADTQDRLTPAACAECGGYEIMEPAVLEEQVPRAAATYYPIAESSCFRFSINHPVDIEYRLTNCELHIYFTDAFNNRRFLYFEFVDNKLKPRKEFYRVTGFDSACNAPVYGTELDCNKMLLEPRIARGFATISDVISGGQCQSGTYQFFLCYADVNGNQLSEYSPGTNPLPVHRRDLVIQDDLTTDRGILLSAGGLDYSSYYRYYNIAVCRTVNGASAFYQVATLPIGQRTFFYTDNLEDYTVLTELDILRRPAYWKSARWVTSSNNVLYWGGMKESPKGNWQRVANMIRILWQTEQIPLKSYADPRMASEYRSLMRDEVYALGVIIEFDNGEETDCLHLPGRPATAQDREPVTGSDVYDEAHCVPEGLNERWRIYNTATASSYPHEVYRPCMHGIWEYGEFGYWESSAEYPDNEEIWGELRCKKIRHHKVPDCAISPLYDGKDATNRFEYNPMIYPIGIRMDHQSFYDAIREAIKAGFITAEMGHRITGYRIVRGNRAGQESIQAKGLLYDVWNYDKEGRKWHYPNYPFNDLRPDPFISNSKDTYDKPDSIVKKEFQNTFTNTGRYTFHSPDTHFRSPDIGSELKIEMIAYGQAQGYFSKVKDHPKYKFLSAGMHILAMAVGFAAALSQDKKQCQTLTNQGALASELGLASGAAEWLPAGATSPAAGRVFNYSGGIPLTGQDFTASTQVTDQCTGRFRDFLPATHHLFTNPWRSGFLVGPHPGYDMNPLFIPLTALMADPRVVFDIYNSFLETDKFLTTLEFLIPWKNMAYQYQAIGKYNSYKLPAAGNIRRKIVDFTYLRPDSLRIPEHTDNPGETTTVHFNNYWRESSLYLRIPDNNKLNTASDYVPDNSRVRINDCGEPETRINTDISSFYAALKTPRLDQYGSVYDIDYIECGRRSFTYYADTVPVALDYGTVFGGDTFISQFAVKRKLSFFTDTAFGLPDGSDFLYEDRGNVGFPNYYFNTRQPLGERLAEIEFHIDKGSVWDEIKSLINGLVSSVGAIMGVEKNRFDCDTTNLFYQKGKIYLYSYGIPYYIGESTVNTDLRVASNTKEGDFYPRVQDLDYWLQEKYVTIREDNQYHYNKDYSKQNVFIKATAQAPDYVPNMDCVTTRDNLVIYSADQEGDNSGQGMDRWLQNLVADSYEFSLDSGKLISAEGIENDKVLCRFEHNMRVFNSYVTLNTSADTAIISTGKIFSSKPQEFARTDIGHLGTRHKAILNTEVGHITVDAERGNIFLLEPGAGGTDDLARYGNRNFFQQNLPFQIKRDFPYIPDEYLDNPFKRIGIALGYDKRFKRLFITKHDYRVLRKDIKWEDGDFYVPHKKKVLDTVTEKSCPAGYTLSADGTKCIKKGTLVKAFSTGVNIPFTGGERTLDDYSDFGSIIYSSYNQDGTAVSADKRYLIPATNKFWINDPRGANVNGHYINGPLNRCGIWNNEKDVNGDPSHEPYGVWVGAVVRLHFDNPTTVYVGCAGDNKIRIKLGCQVLVEMSPTSMGTSLGIYPPHMSAPFRWWHIYPVSVPAGDSYLEITGWNNEFEAVFGAEIYLNTYEEIIEANGYAPDAFTKVPDTVNVLWSTNELKGKKVDNFEYTCNSCEPALQIGDTYWCGTPDEEAPVIITEKHVEREIIEKQWTCVQNPAHFCDLSWTMAFRLDYKFWIGWYPFKPNFYIGYDTFFQVGINPPCGYRMSASVWSHLLTNKSYQVFFGRFYPWELQLMSEVRPDFTILEYLSFKVEFWRYVTEDIKSLKQDRTLSKAAVFTDRASTGMLKLNMNGQDHSIRYPYMETDQSALNVRLDYHEGQYSLNYLYDQTASQYNGMPLMTTGCGTWHKVLNPAAINWRKPSRLVGRLRSETFQARFINSEYSNYKIMFHWVNFFTSQSQV
jgi:hypothetical protein